MYQQNNLAYLIAAKSSFDDIDQSYRRRFKSENSDSQLDANCDV